MIRLVTTVVPWPRKAIASPDAPHCCRNAATPSAIAAAGSDGVEGSLKCRASPVASSVATRSVKVPPTSMPIRITAVSEVCALFPVAFERSFDRGGIDLDRDPRALFLQVHGNPRIARLPAAVQRRSQFAMRKVGHRHRHLQLAGQFRRQGHVLMR